MANPVLKIGESTTVPISLAATVAAVVAFAIAFIASWPFFTVGEFERTVVARFGQLSHVAGPGLHFRIPIVDTLETFPVNIQRISKDRVNTYTIDNQELNAAITLNYRIPEDKVDDVYKNNRDYKANLEFYMVDRFKREMGKVNILQVASRRGEVAASVKKTLEAEATTIFGIAIVDFQITDLSYTDSYRRAVDAAATAKAKVEQAEQEKREAEVVALRKKIQAEGEANAEREQARGKADAQLLLATAQAKGKELVGLAEAKALEAQGEALKSNIGLIQLEYAKRWSGNLPVNMYGSAPLPFITLGPETQVPAGSLSPTAGQRR